MKYRIEACTHLGAVPEWNTSSAITGDNKIVPTLVPGRLMNNMTRCAAKKMLKYIQTVEQKIDPERYRMVEDI